MPASYRKHRLRPGALGRLAVYTRRARPIASAVTITRCRAATPVQIPRFQSNCNSVSAHSSRCAAPTARSPRWCAEPSGEARPVGNENGYTLGIEHRRRFCQQRELVYNGDATTRRRLLTRHLCSRVRSINCATAAYNGPAPQSGAERATQYEHQASSGHQHYLSNTHTDPGINWDRRRYYGLAQSGHRRHDARTRYIRDQRRPLHINSPSVFGQHDRRRQRRSSVRTRSARQRAYGQLLRALIKLDRQPIATTQDAGGALSWPAAERQSSEQPVPRATDSIGFWVVYRRGSVSSGRRSASTMATATEQLDVQDAASRPTRGPTSSGSLTDANAVERVGRRQRHNRRQPTSRSTK